MGENAEKAPRRGPSPMCSKAQRSRTSGRSALGKRSSVDSVFGCAAGSRRGHSVLAVEDVRNRALELAGGDPLGDEVTRVVVFIEVASFDLTLVSTDAVGPFCVGGSDGEMAGGTASGMSGTHIDRGFVVSPHDSGFRLRIAGFGA